MAQYNIEMNSYDGSQYNKLYPRTLLNNVTDWRNNLYTKSEVNNIQSALNNKISSLQSSVSSIQDIIDSGLGGKTLLTSTTLNGVANLSLPKSINAYSFICIWAVNPSEQEYIYLFARSSNISMYLDNASASSMALLFGYDDKVACFHSDNLGLECSVYDGIGSTIYLNNHSKTSDSSTVSIYVYGL